MYEHEPQPGERRIDLQTRRREPDVHGGRAGLLAEREPREGEHARAAAQLDRRVDHVIVDLELALLPHLGERNLVPHAVALLCGFAGRRWR